MRADCARLSPGEALSLFKNTPLAGLCRMADEERVSRYPDGAVTYVVDTNINYTNVCDVNCTFCAFFRRPRDPDSYVLTADHLCERLAPYVDAGCTTLLLQGGVNRDLPLSYYTDLLQALKDRFPEVTRHCFSPVELARLAEKEGMGIDELLSALKEAGLESIPGGGAEILSDRVRAEVSGLKGDAEAWLSVMRAAHKEGIETTATMMFGHVETDEDIVVHLNHLRELQDETGGFRAFIPWDFKPQNNPLGKRVRASGTAWKYLRVVALARLFLDNFPHIQASSSSQGPKVGALALRAGADDAGSVLMEERVMQEAGHTYRTSVDVVRGMIEEAGFTPVERRCDYTLVGV